MIWLWILLATPVVGFISYHFVVGFIHGFREGWQRRRWRKLKWVWQLCEMCNPHDDL